MFDIITINSPIASYIFYFNDWNSTFLKIFAFKRVARDNITYNS